MHNTTARGSQGLPPLEEGEGRDAKALGHAHEVLEAHGLRAVLDEADLHLAQPRAVAEFDAAQAPLLAQPPHTRADQFPDVPPEYRLALSGILSGSVPFGVVPATRKGAPNQAASASALTASAATVADPADAPNTGSTDSGSASLLSSGAWLPRAVICWRGEKLESASIQSSIVVLLFLSVLPCLAALLPSSPALPGHRVVLRPASPAAASLGLLKMHY